MSVGDIGSKPAATEKGRQSNQKSWKKLPDELGRLKCSCCGELKDVSDFSRSSAAPSGRRSRCKDCSKRKAAEQRAQKSTIRTSEGPEAPVGEDTLADILSTALKLSLPDISVDLDNWSQMKPCAAEGEILKAVARFLAHFGKRPEEDAIDHTWAAVEKDLEQHVGHETAQALAQLAALVGQEAEKVNPTVEVLAGLGHLKAMVEQWIFPPDLKTRRSLSTIMDYWCFVLGAWRLMLLTRVQLSSQGAEREAALKRLCLPGQRPALSLEIRLESDAIRE